MKNVHFIISKAGFDIRKSFLGAFIAKIDGVKSVTTKAFLEEIGATLHFPDYYGQNLDALDEMLNDLEWIKQEKVIIHITNSADWLSKEKSESKVFTIIDLLDATAEDWKWMDEEDETAKKDLRIVFEDSDRIRTLLEGQEITFDTIG